MIVNARNLREALRGLIKITQLDNTATLLAWHHLFQAVADSDSL
jgi:hypothetical protein